MKRSYKRRRLCGESKRLTDVCVESIRVKSEDLCIVFFVLGDLTLRSCCKPFFSDKPHANVLKWFRRIVCLKYCHVAKGKKFI